MTAIPSFPLFAVMWNQTQRQVTPVLHIRIARWLEQGRAPTRLLMAFRGGGKSTLVGLYCAWSLLCDPDMRILVLAADDALAAKMVRQVRRILERHPATVHLRPRRLDQWSSDRFTIKRSLELRDPSMLAKGVAANITGCRADLVICDDVEVPNTCDTDEKRAELRERLDELSYILTPGGEILYAGTPHTNQSLYARDVDPVTGDAPYLHDAPRLEIPILDENGDSAWPERFSIPDIERIKQRTGPLKFASQMLLRPVSLQECRLDPTNLSVADAPPAHIVTQRVAAWDPAMGTRRGDASAVAVACATRDGKFHIDEIACIGIDEHSDIDAATQQCRSVIDILSRHDVHRLILETNGIGKFLPALLRRELRIARYSCAVIETTARRNKAERIVAAFDPLLAAKVLSVSQQAVRSALVTEMRAFHPGGRGRDDALDAAAAAILSLTVSLPPIKRS